MCEKVIPVTSTCKDISKPKVVQLKADDDWMTLLDDDIDMDFGSDDDTPVVKPIGAENSNSSINDKINTVSPFKEATAENIIKPKLIQLNADDDWMTVLDDDTPMIFDSDDDTPPEKETSTHQITL